MRERILDELIQKETWDWWKAQVFYLREKKEYAEAEAIFNEFKINNKPDQWWLESQRVCSGDASGTSVGAMNECEFIIRKMNKLGSRMSLLRMTIASTDDKDQRDLASQQLQQHNIDYRLAKNLFKTANCGDTWSRD